LSQSVNSSVGRSVAAPRLRETFSTATQGSQSLALGLALPLLRSWLIITASKFVSSQQLRATPHAAFSINLQSGGLTLNRISVIAITNETCQKVVS
jgi:hypothetical protein